MWKQLEKADGPRLVACKPGPPKPNGRELRVGFVGANLARGALWTRYKRHTTVKTSDLKARIEAKGLRLTPLVDLQPLTITCPICRTEGQGAIAGRAIRPPDGWLVGGGSLACSVACALACGAGLVPVAMGAP